MRANKTGVKSNFCVFSLFDTRVEDTAFDAKDSEKARGQGPSFRRQVASRPRTETLAAKDLRFRLKKHANINVHIVILIPHAFKRKIV